MAASPSIAESARPRVFRRGVSAARRTNAEDVGRVGETWGEFGTTLRPQPRTTRTAIPASDRKKATHSIATKAASTVSTRRDATPSRSTPKLPRRKTKTKTRSAGRAAPRRRRTFGVRRVSPFVVSRVPRTFPIVSGTVHRAAPGHAGRERPRARTSDRRRPPCDTCGRKFNARALEIRRARARRCSPRSAGRSTSRSSAPGRTSSGSSAWAAAEPPSTTTPAAGGGSGARRA